jgi:hypothetical protein
MRVIALAGSALLERSSSVTHVALVGGHLAGTATMGVLVSRSEVSRAEMSKDTYVSHMPDVQRMMTGRRFAGLEVWEHLVAAQLCWIDRNDASNC